MEIQCHSSFRGSGAQQKEKIKLSGHAEKWRRQGIMMKDSAAGSALPRHDPTEEKHNDFGNVISKTRRACVITRIWPSQRWAAIEKDLKIFM